MSLVWKRKLHTLKTPKHYYDKVPLNTVNGTKTETHKTNLMAYILKYY